MSEEEKKVAETVAEETLENKTPEVTATEGPEVSEKMEEQFIYDPTLPVISMKKLLDSGVHFGHQTRKWNPKMGEYIFTARNGIHIINLEKTIEQITKAYELLKDVVQKQGKILIVGTKKQAQETVKEEALRSGCFYVNNRWLGGTLTNFKTIRTRIQRLIELEQMESDGILAKVNKKELSAILKEKEKLTKNLSGIKEIRRLPNALIIIDPMTELNAVHEARKLNIPVIGTTDTNCDPDLVDIAIPTNDDSGKAIRLITAILADAVVEAKGGIPLLAHTNDAGEEITMKDVVANADKVNRERIELIRQNRRERQEAYEARQAAWNERKLQRAAEATAPKEVKVEKEEVVAVEAKEE